MLSIRTSILHLAILLLVAPLMALGADGGGATTPLEIPGGGGVIGLDDIGFARSLHRVLVPAGRTGNLDLIDPDTMTVTSIGGFSTAPAKGGGLGQGITSADEGGGFLFAIDRTAKRLDVIDPKTRSIAAWAPLASGPDYVRFSALTSEVWVTEPHEQRIEVFSLSKGSAPKPSHAAFIELPAGPEALLIDNARGRAYTNLRTDTTLAIDLKSRKIAARWKNACAGSNGLASDALRGFLFVGCREGKLSVLAMDSGKQLGSASSGAGVDIVAYNPRLAHVYLPGAASATMAVVGIAGNGTPAVLGVVATAKYAHCVAADDKDRAYVCDPAAGRILVYADKFPASR
ncbi:MAG TPA: hypothetical protein VEC38_03830 [Candidatus Binataceae bacterium]|nr:hypothetical protein [Candidatus Binataceae bacterium]